MTSEQLRTLALFLDIVNGAQGSIKIGRDGDVESIPDRRCIGQVSYDSETCEWYFGT